MSQFPTWRRGVNWTNRVSYYSIGLNIYFVFSSWKRWMCENDNIRAYTESRFGRYDELGSFTHKHPCMFLILVMLTVYIIMSHKQICNFHLSDCAKLIINDLTVHYFLINRFFLLFVYKST